MSNSDPQLVTFGCRLNTYESEVMREHAKGAGLEGAIIFNTCAVTKEAERQARQAIRKARRDNPQAEIIVTGCSAQIDPQKYSQMDEVDRVIGNDLKLDDGIGTCGKAGQSVPVGVGQHCMLIDPLTVGGTAL